MQTLALHDWHANLGASFNPQGRPTHYSSVASEYAALRTTTGVVDFSDREALWIRGPDRDSFLHGMVTQDIHGMSLDSWAYATVTTAKGAMVGDARVLKRAQELLLDVEPMASTELRAHLESFLISEDAEIQDASAERGALAVIGPQAKTLVQRALKLVPEGSQVAGDSIWAFQHTLLGFPSVELLVPRSELLAVVEALRAAGAAPVGELAYEILRVEAGLPRMGQDMDHATIPLEANLERAISYQKGCYVGQEVIARATFRGHVNKKLVGLSFPDALPPHGTELFHGEKRVGKVTSAVESPRLGRIGLGYVHRSLLQPGTQLSAPGRGSAVVAALPFPRD